MSYPPGTIGITGGEFLRYGGFVMSLTGCWKPDGTRVMLSQSINLPENLNRIIREMTGDWLWLQADDHRWGGQALRQLLDRDVDVVVPLILRRGPPFVPVIFKELSKDGYIPYGYDEIPQEGLVECLVAGSAGMLIRKHVLDAIGDPWFEYEAGEILNEDFVFCKKVRAAGFKIYCDVEVPMGHVGQFTIWPHLKDERWQIGFDMGQSKNGRQSTFYFDPQEHKEE